MQVYRKILVTMDCTPVDAAIVKHVTALALQNEAQVYLLHVVHAHTLDQERTLLEQAETTIRNHRETMRQQGVSVHIIIRSGDPEREIMVEVEDGDYDLVAMATHGHKFFADVILGSVSDHLKHRLRIPLLLLNGRQ